MALALALRVRTQVFKKFAGGKVEKFKKSAMSASSRSQSKAFLKFSCGKFKFTIWVLVLRVPRHHSSSPIPECKPWNSHSPHWVYSFFTRTRTQNNWVPKNFSTSHSCPRTRTRTRECECHFALLALALAHLWGRLGHTIRDASLSKKEMRSFGDSVWVRAGLLFENKKLMSTYE